MLLKMYKGANKSLTWKVGSGGAPRASGAAVWASPACAAAEGLSTPPWCQSEVGGSGVLPPVGCSHWSLLAGAGAGRCAWEGSVELLTFWYRFRNLLVVRWDAHLQGLRCVRGSAMGVAAAFPLERCCGSWAGGPAGFLGPAVPWRSAGEYRTRARRTGKRGRFSVTAAQRGRALR